MANTSYKIRGIEPPDLAGYPPATRKMYWGWVVDLGVKQKVRDLQAGLDRFGKALRPISAHTRKYRRSAMTPSGKGDPSAPPLIPAHMKSRTISLLDGRAFSTHAEFHWRYDAWTGNEWGAVLAYQREHGRDVIGISPASIAKVKTAALKRWNSWKAGRYQTASPRTSTPAAIPAVGSYDTTHATFGIGAGGAEKFGQGQWTGAMTRPEWDAYFRGTARASIPGRPNPRVAPHPDVGPNFNRLLAHVWGKPGAAAAVAIKRPPPAPAPKPKPKPSAAAKRVAMAPVPKPSVKPPYDWSSAVDPSLKAYRDERAIVEAGHARRFAEIGQELRMTTRDVEQSLDDAIARAVGSSEAYLRIDPGPLAMVLQDGRFKSQFETGTSMGSLDRGLRARVEENVMAVPRNIPDEKRPIYGYGGAPDFADFHDPAERAPRGYGSIAVRFKPGVRERATFTVGDSLGYSGRAVASKISDPSSMAMSLHYTFEANLAKGLIKAPEKALNRIQSDVSYLEIQYHGELSVDDIAEVAFPVAPSDNVRRSLDARRIPWRIIPYP